MKIENYQFPKSSFLSIDKDLTILIDKFLSNESLKKLLYYTTEDALSKENLTKQQSLGLFRKNIKVVPKITVDASLLDYIIISFDNFIPNMENPEFRDNVITFDIICHFDTWQLSDLQLRPYRIAGEIDSMLDGKRLTGIGKLEFMGASQLILSDEFAGLSLMYRTIHGEEDKKDFLNPIQNEAFIKEFNEREN